VRDALGELWRLYPGLRDRIVDEQGEVRQHVNIFVGGDAIRFTDGLATPVPMDRKSSLCRQSVEGEAPDADHIAFSLL